MLDFFKLPIEERIVYLIVSFDTWIENHYNSIKIAIIVFFFIFFSSLLTLSIDSLYHLIKNIKRKNGDKHDR